jgi:hypothetical protein
MEYGKKLRKLGDLNIANVIEFGVLFAKYMWIPYSTYLAHVGR